MRSIALMFTGYVAMAIVTYYLSKKLFGAHPFGEDTGRFWWSKWLPGLGFSLLLMAAGEPSWMLIPGVSLVVVSLFFIPKQSS